MRQHTFDVYRRTTKTILRYQQYDELANIQAKFYVFDFKNIFQ